MVPIITSRAYSVGPILESNVPGSNPGTSKIFSNCANEAKQCQARIHCLEQALGLMQNELDRLQKEEKYSSSDADSWSSTSVSTGNNTTHSRPKSFKSFNFSKQNQLKQLSFEM